MTRGARRAFGALGVTMLVAGVVTTTALTASAGQDEPLLAADCGSTVYRLMFWPDGHTGLTTEAFASEYVVPHVEVYTGTDESFPQEDLVAYGEPGSVQITGADCEGAKDTDKPKEPRKLKTTKKAAQFICTTKKSPMLGTNDDVPGGGIAFTLSIGRRRVAVVTVTPPGAEIDSQVVYNSKLCTKSDAPA
jgi:hypothetical protein